MIPTIKTSGRKPGYVNEIILLPDSTKDIQVVGREDEWATARAIAVHSGNDYVVYFQGSKFTAYVFMKDDEDWYARLEQARILGDTLRKPLKDYGIEKVLISQQGIQAELVLAFAEGMALGSYQYARHKTKETKNYALSEIMLYKTGVQAHSLKMLNTILHATAWARDLGNEPLNKLGATELAAAFKEKTKPLGVKVEIYSKKRIEALRMGGLLAVNRGSEDPPTFSILEWKPKHPRNEKPIVLVGKGVVFDTGGISIKPASNMEEMKSDMAGAAAAAAVTYVVAALDLPIHLVALIPATDNRPSGNAFVPGDIITMFDGSTVEVINTDAEGRMMLADALAYAKKFDPLLAINIATLTGSAARATGKLAAVGMQKGAEKEFALLKEAGEQCRERLVEFPMWKEYEEMIRSEVADVKNIGSAEAGAITAGLFLARFTQYPFIHLDIAGTAYLSGRHNYRGQGATGATVRLLVQFLLKMTGQLARS